MQIILLEKVVNLGNLGEIVKVKDGYARNFLIPSGAARRATEANKAEFEAKRVELEKQAAEKLAAAQAEGEKLSGHTVKLSQKAGVDVLLLALVLLLDHGPQIGVNGLESLLAVAEHGVGPVWIGRFDVKRIFVVNRRWRNADCVNKYVICDISI